MRKIVLSGGPYVALVSDYDYEIITKDSKGKPCLWQAAKCGTNIYARRTIRVNGKKQTIYMHRLIMNASKDMQVDHKNGRTLDNRRCNLENVTPDENVKREHDRLKTEE